MNIVISTAMGAILSTIPIGPINLILMQFVMGRRWKPWSVCLAAAVLADGLVCLLSLVFFAFIKARIESYLSVTPVVLSGLLVVSGLSTLFSRPKGDSSEPKRSLAAYFLFGFFLTLSGPGLAPFWLSWWGTAPQTALSLPIVALGFLLGDLAVFGLYAALVLLFPKPGFTVQRRISQGFSLVLVGGGILVFVGWLNGFSPWQSIDRLIQAKFSS